MEKDWTTLLHLLNPSTQTCMHAGLRVHTCTLAHVSICVHTHTHTHVHTHTHTHVHTHTHTHMEYTRSWTKQQAYDIIYSHAVTHMSDYHNELKWSCDCLSFTMASVMSTTLLTENHTATSTNPRMLCGRTQPSTGPRVINNSWNERWSDLTRLLTGCWFSLQQQQTWSVSKESLQERKFPLNIRVFVKIYRGGLEVRSSQWQRLQGPLMLHIFFFSMFHVPGWIAILHWLGEVQ